MMISTGHEKLDSLLGGGVRPSAITDIYGAAGTGKTQLVKRIAANSVVSGKRVFFVDTTGKFRPERVLEMVRDQNRPDSLDSLYVMRATSSSEQSDALRALESKEPDLVVVDSASDLYSFEYGREAQSALKNSLFMQYMHELSSIALRLGIPVIITNVIREFDGVVRENLQPAIRQFTHARIGLSKVGTGFVGRVMLPGKTAEFAYVLGPAGLCEPTQRI